MVEDADALHKTADGNSKSGWWKIDRHPGTKAV
jgi:hypothetical protein